ncbi:MAG: LmeA family phospholipid-binding protein [bacterium]
MRKLSYVIVFMMIFCLISGLLVYSAPKQQVNTCPCKPYPLGNILSRGFQKVFGLNLLASKVVESQAKKQLQKMIDKGEIELNLQSYSVTDLIAGKIKNIELKAKNVSLDDVFISYIEAKSLCDFIYINYKKDPVEPLAPIYVAFKGTITENDINKSLLSSKYQDQLKGIKVKIYGRDLQFVDFFNPKVDINNNRVYFSADVHIAGVPVRIPMKVGSGIRIVNKQIRLADIQIVTKSFELKPIADLIEMQKPVVFDLNKLEKDDTKINIKKISINNDKIDIEGTVWLAGKT